VPLTFREERYGMKKLTEADLRNEFVETFPGDDSGRLDPRQTPGALYSLAMPTPVKGPGLIAWSEDLAAELGLSHPKEHAEIEILGGNLVTPSMKPYAACYAGHQFGNWAGQLGDGRAITLGEHFDPTGRIWELQLKGAGPTAYSRRADGRAVLRSSVREYLMSEAMHHLGVPTTRALSLVTTGDKVLRDMFYDGNPAYEPGAIVMRVAPSFLRFGNFELLAARKETELLAKLVDWTIDRYYPHITGGDRVIQWFSEVIDRTAQLMAEWMRVGFVHGVMNTDNMSILGLTIDYGPYSFLDDYDLNFTPNTTDLPGRRYAFGQQASIAQWNLGCLAGALSPLFPDTRDLIAQLEGYRDLFMGKYREMMKGKLGLDTLRSTDTALIARFEEVLSILSPDMTIFYQLLMELPAGTLEDERMLSHFEPCFYTPPVEAQSKRFIELIRTYQQRRASNTFSLQQSRELMEKHNPRVVLRNYLLHRAIEELENGTDDLFKKLHAAMKEPYSRNHEELVAKRPEWAMRQAGCSMLSCSS
jgi:serine/tyrosine/threonine adenylyltransferase